MSGIMEILVSEHKLYALTSSSSLEMIGTELLSLVQEAQHQATGGPDHRTPFFYQSGHIG